MTGWQHRWMTFGQLDDAQQRATLTTVRTHPQTQLDAVHAATGEERSRRHRGQNHCNVAHGYTSGPQSTGAARLALLN